MHTFRVDLRNLRRRNTEIRAASGGTGTNSFVANGGRRAKYSTSVFSTRLFHCWSTPRALSGTSAEINPHSTASWIMYGPRHCSSCKTDAIGFRSYETELSHISVSPPRLLPSTRPRRCAASRVNCRLAPVPSEDSMIGLVQRCDQLVSGLRRPLADSPSPLRPRQETTSSKAEWRM